MRKTSIDELPQLINVLLGHMSIVGPRPHPIELDAAFTELLPDFMRRYDVKPGMTGLAQIKGLRGPTQTVEIMNSRLLADLEYVDIWSITKDIQIIFATIPAVLFPTNAY